MSEKAAHGHAGTQLSWGKAHDLLGWVRTCQWGR